MKTLPQFLPLITDTVAGYAVAAVPSSWDDKALAALATESRAVADFMVDTPRGRQITVSLYYRTDRAPIPYGYGIGGMDGGELSFESPAHKQATELTDYDGTYCLPNAVAVVLRALGFIVADDNLSKPL